MVGEEVALGNKQLNEASRRTMPAVPSAVRSPESAREDAEGDQMYLSS